MSIYKYAETATITIVREVDIEAETETEALEIANETLSQRYNPETDNVLDYETTKWGIQKIGETK